MSAIEVDGLMSHGVFLFVDGLLFCVDAPLKALTMPAWGAKLSSCEQAGH